MGVGQDDFIAMTHFGEQLEQLGTDTGVDAF